MAKPKRLKNIAKEIIHIPKCPRSGEDNLLYIILNQKKHGKR
jgi:hypothetical protein